MLARFSAATSFFPARARGLRERDERRADGLGEVGPEGQETSETGLRIRLGRDRFAHRRLRSLT